MHTSSTLNTYKKFGILGFFRVSFFRLGFWGFMLPITVIKNYGFAVLTLICLIKFELFKIDETYIS
jgi:hypothetical protein